MITTFTTRAPGKVPAPPAGTYLVASIDVEWTKNYRIPNGNVPFCYSITYLFLPTTGTSSPAALPVEISSRYVHDIQETGDLVTLASAEIAQALHRADLIVGHQLSSDLAVLAAAGRLHGTPAHSATDLDRTRTAWHQRRQPPPGPTAQIIDTRYDAGHLLTNPSRRLVDVCTELRLDVTQPELKGTSMTAVHRRWLDHADTQARERVTVLNLRHGLSTALVALISAGRLPAGQPANVNALLARHLPDTLGWLRHPTFTGTLPPP